MGYRVRRLTAKTRAWKVQYEFYKEKRRVSYDIKEKDYERLGLSTMTPIELVKDRCRQLNSQSMVKKLEEKRQQIYDRTELENLRLNAHLSPLLVKQFEDLYIKGKLKSHWLQVKRAIVELAIDPADWAFYRERFYSTWRLKNYSYSYIQKLILLLNKWGSFLARSRKSYYEPVPFPKHTDKERIIDNHELVVGTHEASPLDPILLFNKRGKFKEEQYRWLHLSVWFGLRPSEVDILLQPSSPHTWWIKDKVLWVYQTKLTGISKSKRVKPIPIKYIEQELGIRFIQEGGFKRPLTKTTKKYLGDRITCYSGRKGFTDLMLSKGNSLEAISQWLGHQSIERTWRVYKNKKTVLV